MFNKGVTAKLAAEIAESGKAELDLSIAQEVRAETARRVALEQEALSAKPTIRGAKRYAATSNYSMT
jgi:hypothetical protein